MKLDMQAGGLFKCVLGKHEGKSEKLMTHPVEYWCPSLHGDALEDSDAGVDDIVEAGYAVVGPLPFFQAYRYVGVAAVAPTGSGRGVVRVARHHLPTFRHDLI